MSQRHGVSEARFSRREEPKSVGEGGLFLARKKREVGEKSVADVGEKVKVF